MSESYRTKKRSDRIVMTDEARVLKLLRSEAKLSTRKVTDAIGVSDTYIAHLENGRIDLPPEERLKRLLKVYGARVGTFTERVRTYRSQITPEQELTGLLKRLRPHEVSTLVAVAKSLVR